MMIAKVVGRVVATRKDDKLVGSKLLIVCPLVHGAEGEIREEAAIVAVDTVGAGVGEEVLVALGSAARLAEGLDGKPIDAAIVGIVDARQQ